MKTKIDRVILDRTSAQDKKVRAGRRGTLALAKNGLRGQNVMTRTKKYEKNDEIALRTGEVSAKERTRFGHWNVRTLYKAGKLHILTEQLKRLNIKICGVSETHLTGAEKMKVNGYTIWFSGKVEGEKHEHGVAIAVADSVAKSVTVVERKSDRIIRIRAKFKHADVTMIEAYAPTEEATDVEKDKFYTELQETISNIPRHDIIILMGDLNAKVGCNSKVWGRR